MRFDWPIATPGDVQSRVSSRLYPKPWQIALHYTQYYLLGGSSPAIHEGDDLITGGTADIGAPVYAIANGVVIYATVRPDSWDGLVVIEHTHPDETKTYSRYGHMTGLTVQKGDWIENGTVIGYVGNAKGRFGYHLHFSICITDAWVKTPWHWQKDDEQFVLDNCVDPEPWIMAHRVLDDSGEIPMPDSTAKLVKITTPAASYNMRLYPNGPVIDTILPGAVVTAYGDVVAAGTYSWQKIETPALHTGWCWVKYLTPIAPTQPPTITGSRFGLNLIGNGAYNEVLSMVDRLARAGKPLALAVVIDEWKTVGQIKALSPKTIVVYRSTAMPAGIVVVGNPEQDKAAGKKFFADYRGLLTQGIGADYFQFANEWMSYDDPKLLAGGVNAYVGMMEAAGAAGIKITVGDLNVGHPHPTLNNLLEPMLAKAEALGYPFNYHAYTKPGSLDPSVDSANYTMHWLDFVKNRPKLKVIIGEFGPNDGNAQFPGSAAAVEMCRKYDTLLKNSQVLGYAYFGAAGSTGSWSHSDITPALPDVEQWLKSF